MTAYIGNVGNVPTFYADRDPTQIAIHHFDGAISYGELDRRADQVANGVLALGVSHQQRVALLSKNDPRYFELFFGLARGGVVLAPVNWRLSDDELAFVIDDTQATLLFVSAEYAPVIDALRERLPHVRNVIVFDGAAIGAGDYDVWRDAQDAAAVTGLPDCDQDVLQLYTSGTTGLPKGAMLTNGNILSYLQSMRSGPTGPYQPGTLVLVPLPLFHVAGACWGLNALYNGVANLLLREASAPLIMEAFRRYPVTKAGLVPVVMKLMLDSPDIGTVDFSHLDTLAYGASPISPELLQQARRTFDCRFVQMFGMTESCSLATFLSGEDHDPSRPEKMLSVGKAAAGVEIRLGKSDGGPVLPGESGEILISSLTIMKGYWRRPEATAEAIVDGWYRTGDVGAFDEDGFLYIRDRVKDMIISGGENVYSAEVERALGGFDKIAEVAVIGVPHPLWGEAVKAVVVPRDGVSIGEVEVIAYARTRLAGYKCPKSVDFTDALPRNGSGKVLKRVLREPYWKDRARGVA